jgi:hypothetical protein
MVGISVELGIKEIFSNGKRFFGGIHQGFIICETARTRNTRTLSLTQGKYIDASFDPMRLRSTSTVSSGLLIRRPSPCLVMQRGACWKQHKMICGQDHGAIPRRIHGALSDYWSKNVLGESDMSLRNERMEGIRDRTWCPREVRLGSGKIAFCGYMHDSGRSRISTRKVETERCAYSRKFFQWRQTRRTADCISRDDDGSTRTGRNKMANKCSGQI